MRLKVLLIAIVVGFACFFPLTPLAVAHHSFAAEYDASKPCKMTGVVTKFDLTNPHSWIHIEVKEENGTVSEWKFETANPNSLYRRGFKKGMIEPGMMVTIQGFLAKDGSHTGNAHILTMPDGKVIQLGSETNPG